MRPRFALLGAAGYVAPKHMRAIAAVGGDLVAICDPHDAVGVVDQYFPSCRYFREPEILDRHLERFRSTERAVDYVSICTPNYLHDAHCRMAMRAGADAICEKPLTLKPHNLDALTDVENETGRRVHPILQLRHSAELAAMRDLIRSSTGPFQMVVQYYTQRGPWYRRSWKGDPDRSGGPITNIGIHILDACLWLLGGEKVGVLDNRLVNGKHLIRLSCDKGIADITLSLGYGPDGERAWRRINLYRHDFVPQAAYVQSLDLSDFGDLHTAAYQAILDGRGLTLADARPAVALADRLRETVTHG